MSVSIPLSWIKCDSCGQLLRGGKVNESNEIVCAKCGAANKIFIVSGGQPAHSISEGCGGKKLNTVWR